MKLLMLFAALSFTIASALASALAQPPMVIERVVPPGASLTYSVDGVPVHTIRVPEGRVRVVITFGDPIRPRHGSGK